MIEKYIKNDCTDYSEIHGYSKANYVSNNAS